LEVVPTHKCFYVVAEPRTTVKRLEKHFMQCLYEQLSSKQSTSPRTKALVIRQSDNVG